ncbi:MAG TPA: PD-(D/E)XK nuclease family protein [Beutenbergiaceae bacterium]|nr:PD-(D/E)XK nuclease family protein [Beutenbergiaceae bacterium]
MAVEPFTHPSEAAWPPGSAHHLVIGAPQSGKTTLAVNAFVDHVRSHGPRRAVFLTPTRQRAAALQNVIAHKFGGTTGQLLVRTPASLAFGLLRQGASSRGEPTPTLITGPEQDQILAELIAGHLTDGVGPGWPPEITPQVLSMRAFRDELRDLLMRAAEAGLDGPALAEQGVREERPEWVAAGRLLTEYTAVTILGEITPDRGARYDAATILDRAAAEIVNHPELRAFDALVHDDYQDATLATSRLLGELARGGARLLLTANPDTGVQGFRGGLPALTHTATLPEGSQDGAFGAQVHVLDSVTMAPRLWQGLSELAEELPPLIGAARRRATAGGDEGDGGVQCVLLPSGSQEAAFIARRLRELHLFDDVPWSDIAVVVRGHHQLTRLRRALAHAGVPVKVTGAEVPLREEPVVRALLVALDVATSAAGADIAHASELLMSAFGGIDALALRRMRRTLRQHDPSRSSADLLLAALQEEELREVAGNHPGLHRIARMLAAGRSAVLEGLGVDMVLWRIWDAAGVAKTWQHKALTPGHGAARADADLDAAVALFTVAEQFVDRRAGASPRAFIDHLAGQDFPADTLAARADRTEAVALHTAASAAGEHWPVVVVAGVQEDTWPDLRLRDTLLGAATLADLATSRHRAGAHNYVHARQEVLHDELRMFLSACSRARRHLIVTAVLDADARPSLFFDRLAVQTPPLTRVDPPLDLRGLVGTLRAHLTPEPGDHAAERAEAASSLLATLAENDVVEADPQVWDPKWTGSGPVLAEGEKPVLNPSTIERALTCPLQWFLTSHGGRAAESDAQTLGTLIHDIAKNHPRGTEADLRRELDERWHELELPDNHIGRRARERAEEMVRQLAGYLAAHDAPADVEVSFRVDVGPAVLRGQVDRVEHREAGPHIVDFKTGAARPERDIAQRNPQLGAYQLAAAGGAFTPESLPAEAGGEGRTAGASLVFVAVNKNFTVREQPPLHEDPEPWAQEMIEEAARVVSAATFPAQPSKACAHCPVRHACPAREEGIRLGEES